MFEMSVSGLDLRTDVLEKGYCVVRTVLEDSICNDFKTAFDESACYRQHIAMNKYGFGDGNYKYFKYPLPENLQYIRNEFYSLLFDLANLWNERLVVDTRYPDSLPIFLKECEASGQTKPTPLILKYTAGGFNRLHQDVYGDVSFPFQVAILLSDPKEDFVGGEFILTEQRARQQARIDVLHLGKGDAVIFPSSYKPVALRNRIGRSVIKHGVSTIHSGERYALGIVFHDAS